MRLRKRIVVPVVLVALAAASFGTFGAGATAQEEEETTHRLVSSALRKPAGDGAEVTVVNGTDSKAEFVLQIRGPEGKVLAQKVVSVNPGGIGLLLWPPYPFAELIYGVVLPQGEAGIQCNGFMASLEIFDAETGRTYAEVGEFRHLDQPAA